MEKWRDYEAGKLVPPCVVQHDVVRDENLVWVWDGDVIHGPLSRKVYDEAEVLATVQAIKDAPVVVIVDAKEAEIAVLKEENEKLKADIVVLEKALADADIAPVEEPIEGEVK